jgi:hypothetical protein
MSWSVSASGAPEQVKTLLDQQFAYPLADAPAGLPDENEKETVRRVQGAIYQCLETFGPEKTVSVSAYGHMGYADYNTKEGAYQNVSVTITPTA